MNKWFIPKFPILSLFGSYKFYVWAIGLFAHARGSAVEPCKHIVAAFSNITWFHLKPGTMHVGNERWRAVGLTTQLRDDCFICFILQSYNHTKNLHKSIILYKQPCPKPYIPLNYTLLGNACACHTIALWSALMSLALKQQRSCTTVCSQTAFHCCK